MSFGELGKLLPLRPAIPGSHSSPKPGAVPWRIERSGEFAGYAVTGWRYHGLAIWHVKLWAKHNDEPERSYIVNAGEFSPQTLLPAERFAVLRLLAMWEADGLH